jgi:sulfate adenylyltransferase subunit 1 (EFTu-like GTPase family)
VTLVLADEVDASRGSVITAAAQPPIVSDRLEVRASTTAFAVTVPTLAR